MSLPAQSSLVPAQITPAPRVTIAKLLMLICAGLLVLASARAQQGPDPDDLYLSIYNVIQDADTLSAAGKGEAAQEKYNQAQTALQKLRQRFPSWNPKLVNFRMEYVAGKLAGAAEKPAPSLQAPNEPNAPAGHPASQGVKLLDAGAEPRHVVRLHPKVGDKQTLVMTMKISMAMKMGAADLPAIAIPPMKMTMDAIVKEVSPEHDITYDVVLTDATADTGANTSAPMAAAMSASLSKMKGLSTSVTMTDRGITKDLQMSAPTGSDAQLGQMLQQVKQTFSSISSPLPEEAIGAGAKWEAHTPIKTQGMNIEQTATYQLTSLEGDRLAARSTISQRAANQTMQNPALAGVKASLTKLSSRGSGTLMLDLGRPMPVQSQAETHTDMAMSVDAGGQKQTMSMKLDLAIQLDSK